MAASCPVQPCQRTHQEQWIHVLFSEITYHLLLDSGYLHLEDPSTFANLLLKPYTQYPFSNTTSSDVTKFIFSTQSFCASENGSSCPDTIRHGVRGVLGKTTTEI